MNKNSKTNSCSGNPFIGNIKEVTYKDKSGRKLLHVYLATGCINMGDGSGCIRYQRDVTELVESGEIMLKKAGENEER